MPRKALRPGLEATVCQIMFFERTTRYWIAPHIRQLSPHPATYVATVYNFKCIIAYSLLCLEDAQLGAKDESQLDTDGREEYRTPKEFAH